MRRQNDCSTKHSPLENPSRSQWWRPCAMPTRIQNSERDGNFTTMNHEQIVATYTDIALESITRDLAKITHYGPTRDWADKRLAAARAE